MNLDFIVRRLPDPLPVPITEGERGQWVISTMPVNQEKAEAQNFAYVLRDRLEFLIKPGTYTRLIRKGNDLEPPRVVMSNTPMEVITNSTFIRMARGHVLINGLGLGMALRAVLDKPEVLKVVVYEIDPDVIELIHPGFEEELRAGRLAIRQADCLTYQPYHGEKYDIAWHDIWDLISDENLPEMKLLVAKWRRRIPTQLCWAKDMCLRMRKEIGK